MGTLGVVSFFDKGEKYKVQGEKTHMVKKQAMYIIALVENVIMYIITLVENVIKILFFTGFLLSWRRGKWAQNVACPQEFCIFFWGFGPAWQGIHKFWLLFVVLAARAVKTSGHTKQPHECGSGPSEPHS